MTKICLTPEDVEAHKEVIERWFGDVYYEVVKRWDDGYAAYWVIIQDKIAESPTGKLAAISPILYCFRTFEIAGKIQISQDEKREFRQRL